MSRALRPDLCPRCLTLTLVGDCDLGIGTRVDPGRLSVNGEALAVVLGRRLLELVRIGGVWSLTSRDPDRSADRLNRTAGPGGVHARVRAVLVEHECDAHVLHAEPGPDAAAIIDPVVVHVPLNPDQPGF